MNFHGALLDWDFTLAVQLNTKMAYKRQDQQPFKHQNIRFLHLGKKQACWNLILSVCVIKVTGSKFL